MGMIGRIRDASDRLLYPTEHRVVDLSDPESEASAVAWWEAMTVRGGEGIVVKPLEFVAQGRRGLAQPAVKCRGREYLRIIDSIDRIPIAIGWDSIVGRDSSRPAGPRTASGFGRYTSESYDRRMCRARMGAPGFREPWS